MAFSADVQVDQSQIASSIGITTITRAISGEVPSQNLVLQTSVTNRGNAKLVLVLHRTTY